MKNISKYIVSGDIDIKFDVDNNQISKIASSPSDIDINARDSKGFTIKTNNTVHNGEIVILKQNQCVVNVNGNYYSFTIHTEFSYQRDKNLKDSVTNNNTTIEAPLPGVVCDLMVEKNQHVKKGDSLLILEAMKMQNEIVSPSDGMVKEIYIKTDDNVMKNQELIQIEI